jgi:hypothetical protein
LRGKKPPVEIRQVGITYDPKLPYMEISQYTLIRQVGITHDPNLPYLEISQCTLTSPRSHNRSGTNVVTGVLKQSGSPLCRCRGSQEQGQVVVAMVEEAVLQVAEVNDAEVKIIDVEEVAQESWTQRSAK